MITLFRHLPLRVTGSDSETGWCVPDFNPDDDVIQLGINKSRSAIKDMKGRTRFSHYAFFLDASSASRCGRRCVSADCLESRKNSSRPSHTAILYQLFTFLAPSSLLSVCLF